MTTEQMQDRIDALFPPNDGGYGDDMRRLLRLADEYDNGWTRDYTASILRVLDELTGRMQRDEDEQAAECAYWSEQEAATL